MLQLLKAEELLAVSMTRKGGAPILDSVSRGIPAMVRALLVLVILAAAAGTAPAQSPPSAPLCDQLAAHPSDPERFGEGLTLDRMDGGRAADACAEAVAEEPGNLRLVYQLGRALAAADREDEAEPHLRRAAMAGYVAAMYSLADLLIYRDSGKDSTTQAEGLQWMRRAAERNFGPALAALGTLHDEGRGVPRDRALAVSFYRRAGATNDPLSMQLAGSWFDERAGNDAALIAEAERLLRAAVAAGWRDAYNELAWFLYTRDRDMVEAERLARRAVAAYPEDPAFADTLGAILLRRNQAAAALPYLEFAAQSEGDNPDFHERLGDALWALGRRDEAREAWNDALSNTESDNQRQRLRDRLARQ